ncbi:phosphatase PAP2 family protein [Lactobacillaceae bacterium Scapto_B20]
MSLGKQRSLFGIAVIGFIVTMVIAGFGDLAISNTFINYNSWFGTFFQVFGEFPVYMILVLSGEIAIAYGLKVQENRLLSWSLIAGGVGLSAWQLQQYLKEIESYIAEIMHNMDQNKPIGLANSDSSAGVGASTTIVILIITYLGLTWACQAWFKTKSQTEIKQLLIVSLFASLTVFFAYEVNHALKDLWGRVRPYELSSTQKEFTDWFVINGSNGHRSFPSGHTMAGTLMIVFSWFLTGKARHNFWIFGIIFGILVAISRIVIGAHFTGDVFFSMFLTMLIIFVMWELYKIIAPKDDELTASI